MFKKVLSVAKSSAKKTEVAKMADGGGKSAVHHSGWNYRCGPPPTSKKTLLCAELVQGFAWWWILWHMWTEPGHVFGEFPYPNPRKWTNAELFIPKDHWKYSDVTEPEPKKPRGGKGAKCD